MTTCRVASLPELVSIVPHLLGFHPEDSAVAVGIRRSTVEWVLRRDLPPASGELPCWRTDVARACEREKTDRVVVLLYVSADANVPGYLGSTWVRTGREEAVGVVCDGMLWWCDEGLRSATIPEESAAAVALIAEGIAPHGSRAARIGSVECAAPLVARAVEVARVRLASTGMDPQAAAAAWAGAMRHDPHGDLPDPRALAHLLVSVAATERRDAVIGAVVPALWCPVSADDTLAVMLAEQLRGATVTVGDAALALQRIARSVDGPGAVGLLAVSAAVTWAAGDAVLAEAMARRVLRIDPGHSLAGLILQATRVGLRPGA